LIVLKRILSVKGILKVPTVDLEVSSLMPSFVLITLEEEAKALIRVP